MTAILEKPKQQRAPFQAAPSGSSIPHIIETVMPGFDQALYSYALFNAVFLTLGCIEFALLLFFFTFLMKSALLAFSLAAVFLTCFSYFILRVYFQTKKMDQLEETQNRFLFTCRTNLGYQEGKPESYLALAHAYTSFANGLDGKEHFFYTPPTWLGKFSGLFEKFSGWSHWHDVHQMKEMLLLKALNENIKLVKASPVSLEAHAALANAYVVLSSLYSSYQKHEKANDAYFFDRKFLNGMQEKYRSSSKKAIEEFKIISNLSPDDTWVHQQLAYSYHDLQMPEEEIHEYECLANLLPNDPDIRFKLGVLYFQQGKNAQGLHMYEYLKHHLPKKAEELITYYGSTDIS